MDAEKTMIERTLKFHDKATVISIGIAAPGPMIKYGNLLYSYFPNKTIVSKIETPDELINKLENDVYDFIFTTKPIETETLVSQFAYAESLYITVPKEHFLAGLKTGVHFSEIDGQSFLVSNNLGIWHDIVSKFLPKSKFFPQSMDNLYEIINASTIPNFSTNITLPMRAELNRVSMPVLDDEATVKFYLVYKKQNKPKLKKLLSLLK